MRKAFETVTCFIFIVFLIGACSIFHKTAGTNKVLVEPKDELFEVSKNRISYNCLSIRDVFVKSIINGNENSFKCSLRLIRDSLITVSVLSILGIEIFRIYITNDSVFIIDRANRSYTANCFKDDKSLFPGFVNLKTIQDFLLGNIIEMTDLHDFKILNKGKKYSKFGIIKNLRNENADQCNQIDYVINNEINKPSEFYWRENSDYIHLIYDEYKYSEAYLYPGVVEFELKYRIEKFTINLEIGSLKVLEKFNFHITIPNGYKKK